MGPGLAGWRDSLPVLAGEAPYRPAPLARLKPGSLPASERRRATAFTKLALLAAEDALAHAGEVAALAKSVFASSSGDMEVIDRICTSLMEPGSPVSPTHFHNSVHNAPAGYWGLASGCTESSVSLSGYDWTFGRGLLEAVATVASEGVAVLLVGHDAVPPFPLCEKRRIEAPFAVALLLAPRLAGTRLARLRLSLQADELEDRLADPALEQLRLANPAARCLPLLAAVARSEARAIALRYSPTHQLRVDVRP
jgi:hypothetical protein